MSITIDTEFKALIPPLSPDEYAQLEANLLADGCRDPLVVWGDVLMDGHNRFEICTRLGLTFSTVQVEFESRDDAIEWMIINQFGRRNLSDYQRGVLALRLKPIFEARAKANQVASGGDRKSESVKSVPLNSAEPIQPIETRQEISKIAGVGKDTIRKIEAVESLAPTPVRAAAANGDISVNMAHKFASLPKEDQEAAMEEAAENNTPVAVSIRARGLGRAIPNRGGYVGHGTSGMVYWNVETLKKFAEKLT